MPVRLVKPYGGQAANTLYWGTDQAILRSVGVADDNIELASDYQQSAQVITAATVNTTRNAVIYVFNSASAQTITINLSGYWPIGTLLTFIQVGAGAFTIAPATGVTINKSSTLTSLISKGQYGVAQMVKTAPDTWVAFGGLGG